MTSLARAFLLAASCNAIILSTEAVPTESSGFRVGVGIADITGPVADVVMMGYADPSMVNNGLHTRLYSRAFIVCERSNNAACIVFVSIDTGMAAEIVKLKVVEKLSCDFSALYTMENIMISATHTHSGPAGYMQYFMFQIANYGWVQETFDAQVAGITELFSIVHDPRASVIIDFDGLPQASIRRAHNDLSLGQLSWSRGHVDNVSINRSPTAYRMNPDWERARYSSDIDKEMLLLKISDKRNKPKGMINWFAVHPTSMNKSNTHVSSDNKGYAQLMFESMMNEGMMPGEGRFVAAFAASNLGDVTPNIRGPVCINSGLPCDKERSTCGGRVQDCIASGPGNDMLESTAIIGKRMYKAAKKLFLGKSFENIYGRISYIHQYIDMSKQRFPLRNGTIVNTCPPAMGYSFAAGTTDGPGAFNFFQTDKIGNELWNSLRDLIRKPSRDLIKCHHPKPILLASGQMDWPYQWQPSTVPLQILRVGQLVIVGVPAEFTTMAGRRLRSLVRKVFETNGIHDVQVTIAGLANSYTDYVTTYEEYQKQRYEGASTAYGPHTLGAYLHNFAKLTNAMIQKKRVLSAVQTVNMLNKQISLQLPVLADSHPYQQPFGYVLQQPPSTIPRGQSVRATFVAGHPRNNYMGNISFLEVLHKNKRSGKWEVIANDGSWETIFTWKRTNSLLGRSIATITWNVPESAVPGFYKIKHQGYYKTLWSYIESSGKSNNLFLYQGETKPFEVLPPRINVPFIMIARKQ